MGDYEMFKTTLMGGFDKDDVMQKVEDSRTVLFVKSGVWKKS